MAVRRRVCVRLDDELLELVERVRRAIAGVYREAPGRSSVIRYALRAGLEELARLLEDPRGAAAIRAMSEIVLDDRSRAG